MNRFLEQLSRVAAWFSQGANCIFLAGHQNRTVSSRAHAESYGGSENWRLAKSLIDKLFFWQDEHCYQSYMRDIRWAEDVRLDRDVTQADRV